MTEMNSPTPEQSISSNKEAVILAGGVIDKKNYEKGVKKLAENNNASQKADIHRKTHTDLIALRIQSYEKRDMPSTQIDDAFRVMSSYGNLEHMPKHFPIKIEQINDLTYEMLISAQKNLPDGITAEDIANIGEQSIKNFQEILQSVNTTKETYDEKIEDVRVF